MRLFFGTLPDVHAVEQDVVEDGDTVAARFVVKGTHKGELWNIPATGRHIRWDAIMMYRIADRKIIEQWAIEDWTAILQNIGAVQPPWLQ